MLQHCYKILLLFLFTSAHAGEWNSSLTGELLLFAEDPAFAGQHNSYVSVAIETEFYHQLNGGDDLFVFKPFYRLDQHDDNRSHGDLRELSWSRAVDDWEVLIGVSKVYWGSTEAVHLVDIINQTDFVENSDGEDKLGQPMMKLTTLNDWGTVSFFVLPGFRARTFPSVEGRPRIGAVITDNVGYQSSEKERHIDYAARWSHTIGNWDVGLAYFIGTSREPDFIAVTVSSFQPYYQQIKQFSLDVQASIGSWLLKVEAISRDGQSRHFNAAATGVEYTFVGVNQSDVDVGVIAEYLYDERTTAVFQNDVAVGARIILNDIQSSELLVSAVLDTEGDGQAFNVEGSRRLGERVKLSVEARGVTNIKQSSGLFSFVKDNRLRTELSYYF